MIQDFMPPIPQKKTSGLAITSLVLGCLSPIATCVTGIPAIICGILAFRQIDREPGTGGKGMAIAGIILGGLSLVILPIIAALAIPAVTAALDASDRSMEIVEVQKVGVMLADYAKAHEGKFPDSMNQLIDESKLPEGELDLLLFTEEGHEPRWILTPGLTLDSPPETPLLQSREAFGLGKKNGRAVYYIGGNAIWVTEEE